MIRSRLAWIVPWKGNREQGTGNRGVSEGSEGVRKRRALSLFSKRKLIIAKEAKNPQEQTSGLHCWMAFKIDQGLHEWNVSDREERKGERGGRKETNLVVGI